MEIRKKIILVDDMRTNHTIFKNMVSGLPYDIESFTSPNQIVNDLATIPIPDLFVLDIEMPIMSGIELAKIIRCMDKFKEVPIIFYTSSSDVQHLSDAYAVGAAEFISKLLNPIEIKLRLKNIFLLEDLKKEKNKMNQKLKLDLEINQMVLKTLFHDLGNMLMITIINLRLALKISKETPVTEKLEKCKKGISQIKDCLNSIRTLTTVYNEVPTELPEALSEINALFSDKLTENQMKLEFEETEGLLVKIPKSILVFQILANFIGNAIKFSPNTSTIKIKTFKQNESVVIEITDQGHGISEDIINKMLSKDTYFTSDGERNEKGTGTGTKIARFFIEKYNGELNFVSLPTISGTKVIIKFT